VFGKFLTISFSRARKPHSFFRQAAQTGDVDALQEYAAAGSDLFKMHPVHRVTPLLLAVDNSKLDAVRFLIRFGANPMEINNRLKGAAFPASQPHLS
jgi:hypothetical protein